jgi:hypothetical protein
MGKFSQPTFGRLGDTSWSPELVCDPILRDVAFGVVVEDKLDQLFK